MYAKAEKPKENKSKAVANPAAQKKSNVKQGFGLVDNQSKIVQMSEKKELNSSPNTPVLQAVWSDAVDWQNDRNLAAAAKAVIYGQDFTQNHLRSHQGAHAADMNVYAERYAGRLGAYGGRNTMVWQADIDGAMAAMNYADANVIIGVDGTNRFQAYINLPNRGFEWGPLNPNNAINANNVRLDVRLAYNNIEVHGYVRADRNQAGRLRRLEFKVTHLASSW